MKKLIVANWKMLPETAAQAQELLVRIDERIRSLDSEAFELILCPPFIYIEDVARSKSLDVQLGAQDIALSDIAAQTGEIGGQQLVALGVRYVIVGHSERRWKLGEDESTVHAKLKAALADGLVPVVCLGERSRNGDWAGELATQTTQTFQGLTPGQVTHCLIAYEPVWAISTNPDAKPDTPASAVQAMDVIRQTLADHFGVSAPTFLYGGSVTPVNAEEFLRRPEISGVLIGGASVRIEDFEKILAIAATP